MERLDWAHVIHIPLQWKKSTELLDILRKKMWFAKRKYEGICSAKCYIDRNITKRKQQRFMPGRLADQHVPTRHVTYHVKFHYAV